MNSESTGMESRGMNRPDTPSSASGSNEAPPKLLTEIAAMDHEMNILKNKIQRKKEEEQRLLDAKTSNLTSITNLKKQMTSLQEKERSCTISSNKVKDSHTAIGELETAVVQNLKALKISTEAHKSKCHNVIKKYSTIINSHQESFAALPWVQKNKLLSVEVEKKRVMLLKLEAQQRQIKTKLSMLQQISEKRLRIEILRLANLMTEREKCLRDGRQKYAQNKMIEQEIRSLEQQKCQIQEKIASRTQEMIIRIMSRSSDRPERASGPNVAGRHALINKEMNKSANLRVKDRLGMGKRQDNSAAALSIRDRLGIIRKPLNVSAAPPIIQKPKEAIVETRPSLLRPSPKHDVLQSSIENLAEPSSPIPTTEISAETTEISSNREPNSPTEYELASENVQAICSSPSQLQQDLHLTYPERSIQSTAAVPFQPILKAILKSSSSVLKCSSEPSNIPPPFLEEEDISTAPSSSKDIGQLQSVNIQSKQTQNPAIPPGEVIERPSTTSDIQPVDLEIATGPPAPKKPKVADNMPPPRPTQALQKMKNMHQPPKTPKRVSFVATEGEPRINDSTVARGISTQRDNSCSPTAVMDVRNETKSGELSAQRLEPISKFVEPEDISDGRPSSLALPSTSHKEVPTTQPEAAKFQHLFPPSPQPYSSPQQQQATPGNFDSLFGAIFNTPSTSKDNAGFQFNMQGDPFQKKDGADDAANPSSNTGQDFFSFFGTPNANEPKKSYNDNFFKLF